MAGLTAAYNLTKTPELRALHDVTIYQLGWRLGGKAASGRDAEGRNLEHGLHVWFGYYECSFRLLQEVYAARPKPAGSPLQDWTDAFKPQKHTGVGMKIGEAWTHLSINWPTMDGYPGDGAPAPTLTGALILLWRALRDAILRTVPDWAAPLDDQSAEPDLSPLFLLAAQAHFVPGSTGRRLAEQLAAAPRLSGLEAVEAVLMWLLSLGRDFLVFGHSHLDGIVLLLRSLDKAYRAGPYRNSTDPAVIMVGHLLNVFAAVMAGAVSDLIIPNRSFEALDEEDFSDWLIRHGADRAIVETSALVRTAYDISFQYVDGDPDQRSCAAGSGLGSIIRMLATYKGDMMYLAQAGFGEAVIAPLYEVVLSQGVKVSLFRKVTALELSKDKKSVARVRLARQADVIAEPYEPTIMVDGVRCWPSEPLWDQLEDGDRLKAAKVDFESHWCAEPPVGEETLTAGEDFDLVILSIALGGLKPLGGDPGICAELLDQGGDFANFVNGIDIVPTLALQIWSDRSLEQLGWTTGKSATVAGPQPLDIWADMSQVLTFENRPGPRTLHYFCGSYPTKLYAAPTQQAGVPAQAAAEIRDLAVRWLKDGAGAWFPTATHGGTFDWDVLWDPQGRAGEARLDAQFLRANIDPTECCAASFAGQTKFRLRPHQSGFRNLLLAGEGCRHGQNATAVDAAVMSGMAASQAICGLPKLIPGDDFLSRLPFPEL